MGRGSLLRVLRASDSLSLVLAARLVLIHHSLVSSFNAGWSIWQRIMTTRIVFFPFDLFGSGGAAAGVELLAEAVQEMLDDNRRERFPTRARAYQKHVRTHTFTFDKLSDYQDWKQQARKVI